jgi:hypothetical protein
MGAFAAAPLLLGGLTVATGVLGYQASVNAGKLSEIEASQKAQQESDAAKEREIDRKRRLVRAISNQTATAAARNIDISSGSARAVALSDIRAAERDQLGDTVNTSRRRRSLLFQGSQAAAQGRLQGAASLLDTGINAYRDFG